MRENNTALRERAQQLRKLKNATPQEKKLWYQFLSGFKPRFHRQVTMGIYIVDFYCPEVGLVIEIDGSQHYEPDALEYDAVRTEFLTSCGCHVVRYSNYDVNCDFQSVCEDILKQIRLLRAQVEDSPLPPPIRTRQKE